MKNDQKAPIEGQTANSPEKAAGFSYEKLELDIASMLRAGLHFGHKNSRWNPKMKEYIFGVKNNIHIIDLEKTEGLFKEALEFLANTVENGGKILFVGTKPQARNLVEEVAAALDMPYVKNRWLGGTFTNFGEIKRRIKYFNDQESLINSEEIKKYTKYEQSRIKKEVERMDEKMGGIKRMEKLPQAVFIIDIKDSDLAVKEARRAGIPTVAITDTNTDPTLVDFPIPANDDALSALKYILGLVAKNIAKAKQAAKAEKAGQKNS
ncbi:MAG: 30S ribosomal protein S2 [Candidatus Moranbacteria bacterium]|nr:30S ribosomal protein S2 [Candidatus Moranbacteria bacterium]